MKYNFSLILFVIFIANANCQSLNHYWSWQVNAGLGVNNYLTKNTNAYHYNSLELNVGMRINRTLSNSFLLQSGFSFVHRLKGEKQLKPDNTINSNQTFIPFLESTATRNHYAIDVPICLGYNFTESKRLSCWLSVQNRFWLANDKNMDFLKSKIELLISPKVAYNFLKNHSVEIQYLRGLSKLYQSQINGKLISIYSQVFFINYAYNFNKF